MRVIRNLLNPVRQTRAIVAFCFLLGLTGCATTYNCNKAFYGAYSTRSGNKAMYMGEGKNGGCHSNFNNPSLEEAKKEAYRSCINHPGGNGKCVLWAVNDQLSDYAHDERRRSEQAANESQNMALALLGASAAISSSINTPGATTLSPLSLAQTLPPPVTTGNPSSPSYRAGSGTKLQCSLNVGNASLYPVTSGSHGLLNPEEFGITFTGVSNCPDSVDFSVRIDYIETDHQGGRHQRTRRIHDHAPNERQDSGPGRTGIMGTAQRFEVRDGVVRTPAHLKPQIIGTAVESCECRAPSGIPPATPGAR